MRSAFSVCGLFLLVSASAFLAGMVAVREPLSTVPTVDAAVLEGAVPVVSLTTGESEWQGTVHGNARLVVDSHAVAVSSDGSFAVNGKSAKKSGSTSSRSRSPISAPSGMAFVASKKGKRYYPVGASQAKSIKVENRIFFVSAAAARSAGFTPSK